MWNAIERDSELPAIGARETTQLDFKAKPPTDRFEAAKDVAAFANADGGSLLIGAVGGDHLAKYAPLTLEQAKETERIYDEAVRDRCSPAPVFSFAEVPKDGGFVVAVNVWPFPGQIVGVRIKKDEVRCGTSESQQEGVLLLPLRVGTHTRTITPEQIPMFVDAHARRIAIALNQAVGHRALVFATKNRSENSTYAESAAVMAVDLLGNSVTMGVGPETARSKITIPLDLVDAVCRADEVWHVFVRGKFKAVQWSNNASPDLQALRFILDPCG